MPPRHQTRKTTRRVNHGPEDTASNDTPVDPNMVSAINQAFARLLPTLVAQAVEAVLLQTRSGGHVNTNANSGPRIVGNTETNNAEGIHVWLNRFQKEQPKSFSHATTPIEARNWIAHIEKIFEVLGVEDQYKVRLATYKLEDDAQTWCEGFKQAKGGDIYAATLPWADFCTIFYEKYFSTADREAYIREYAVIRQGNDEPASEFMTRFARLSSIVGDAAGTPEMQEEKCKWAVCDRIQKSIMYMKFKDLTEVADAIKTFEFERKEFLSRTGENKKRDRDGIRTQTAGQSSTTPQQQDHKVQAKRNPGDQTRPWQPRPQNSRPTQNQIQPYEAPVAAKPLNQHGNRNQTLIPPCNSCGKRHRGICRC
ncbi:putative retrotransposon gag domain-containing protein [Helianthus annuus]|nr:putative retrotransposon gag domain-containing protein [Helianthus annuus]